MKTVAIVQARMGSTRFPNKVMRKINDLPMISLLLNRLSYSEELDEIVVATSNNPENKPFIEYLEEHDHLVFRGDEDDVLDRYYHAAKEFDAEQIIRITGDCPLVDASLVDEMIRSHNEGELVDYSSNVAPATFPDGLDIEIFSFDSLKRAWECMGSGPSREHVTTYIRESGNFKTKNFENSKDYSADRWTVDTPEDFEVVSNIFNHFEGRINFSWLDILDLKLVKPQVFQANKNQARNEGSQMSKGQKLWQRAKKVIPGGNMLLSKRAEMFLPEQWPAYYSKSKGCHVWDLEGNIFTDMCIMGIGTNILGYGNTEVDAEVNKAIQNGNMSTLNCPEEVYLAEKLIELHPWADMARFARSGGEANAIAIRIARAASGKDNVAVCGYHGWHDWYLSANLGEDKNLSGHLLPGLEPNGVPKNLKGTVFPFNYNNYNELAEIVKNNEIGVIKMEVARNNGPEGGFLNRVRELATKNGIVLIFDECTSGFRETFGGLHKKYGVEPDMAMFGKAMGNGYAATAVIGRREVMEAAQTTFISSTFWTERIGSVAALKTLEVMEKEASWETITNIGLGVTERWKSLAKKYELSISTSGLPALTSYVFNSPKALEYKTLITQEMLTKGFLASTNLYVCTEHTPQIIDQYFSALDPIFSLIQDCEAGKDVYQLLKGPVCHASFKRLN